MVTASNTENIVKQLGSV